MAFVCCLGFCVYMLCVVCIYCMLVIAHANAGLLVGRCSVCDYRCLGLCLAVRKDVH